MLKCPICKGCMSAKGIHIIIENGTKVSMIRWYCNFCKKYFYRRRSWEDLQEIKHV